MKPAPLLFSKATRKFVIIVSHSLSYSYLLSFFYLSYIFPAVGLAALTTKALTITDEDFIVAAKTLVELVPQGKLKDGCCYPDLSNIREVSQKVAAAVAKHIFETGRSRKSLNISVRNLGGIESILHNYPNKDIKVIVLTDGERILGLGDLGSNGMGISIEKPDGINPDQVLQVTIDVGSNTDAIIHDPASIGIRQRMWYSGEYEELLDEFFVAAQKIYGRTVLFQFEDFGNTNLFRLLERYSNTVTSFKDDIPVTVSVILEGLLASNQLTGKNKLAEHRFLFLGTRKAYRATEDLIASTIVQQSPELTLKEAKERSFFADSEGLVCSERKDLEHHKLPFAHDLRTLLGYNGPGFVYSILFVYIYYSSSHSTSLSFFLSVPSSLSEAVDVVRPTVIVGVGQIPNLVHLLRNQNKGFLMTATARCVIVIPNNNSLVSRPKFNQ
jgi:malic enzyme